MQKYLMAVCALMLAACGDVFFAEPAAPEAGRLAISLSVSVPSGEVFDKANRIGIRASLDAVVDSGPGSVSTSFGPISLDTVMPFSPSAVTRLRVPIAATGTHHSLVGITLMRDNDTLFFSLEVAQVIAGETTEIEFEFLTPRIASITLPPPGRNLTGAGDTLTLVATPRFKTGDVLSDLRGCGYFSLNPAVATVGQNTGRVVAVATGTAQILFSCNGGGQVSVTVTVIPQAGPLATITVTPNPASVPSGGTQQFTAVGKDASGNVVPITPVWAVVNGGGSINGTTGVFTAGTNAGGFTNTVRATSGAISGTATVVVSPSLLGNWAGTFIWNCSAQNQGSSPIAFNVTNSSPTSAQFSGTVTYLGGSGPFTGTRYASATFFSQGDVQSGVQSPTGTIVEFVVPASANFSNNRFTGNFNPTGTRIVGTTVNGQGCSANFGPSGSFDIQKQ